MKKRPTSKEEWHAVSVAIFDACGRISSAAAALGVSHATLHNWLTHHKPELRDLATDLRVTHKVKGPRNMPSCLVEEK